MAKQATLILIVILFLLIACFLPKVTFAQVPIQSQSIVLTVFQDGFVQVDQNLELAKSSIYFNVTLLGETRQNMLVLDENNLPIDYTIVGDTAVIYNIGSQNISISYLTEDLISKNGKYWTIQVDYPEKTVLLLPQNSVIISLSAVPDIIENSMQQLTLTMPSGLYTITYTAEHASSTSSPPSTTAYTSWLILAIVLAAILVSSTIIGFRFLKNKKPNVAKNKPTPAEPLEEVDVDKILSRHRELREDEVKVVRFLGSKQGKAFEAELFALLNLPRTTTWRLIKRLEGMEIVIIKKHRRQNIVLVNSKYLKKENKKTD